MINGYHKKNKEECFFLSGASLLEVLLAVVIFTIGIGTIAHLYIGSYYTSFNSIEKNQALFLAKEGLEAVSSIKNDDFSSIGARVNSGIEINGNSWSFRSDPDIIDEKYTRKINITSAGENAWDVDVVVSWQPLRGEENEVSLQGRMTPWKEPYEYEEE